jgi:hypothetical protein
MSKVTEVEVRFMLPLKYVQHLRSVVRDDGVPQIGRGSEALNEWCRNDIISRFQDKRRTAVAIKRVNIYWMLSLFEGMVLHTGDGGSPAFVRESVWEDLKRLGLSKGLSPLPDWKETRRQNANKRAKAGKVAVVDYKTGAESDYHGQDKFHPVAIPLDWHELIEKQWPGEVSTYIMACAQTKLQLETKVIYPCKRTMKPFLEDYLEE